MNYPFEPDFDACACPTKISVILFLDQIVTRDIKNDKSLKLFQVDHFFDLVDLIVAEVKFHEGLHVFEAVESGDLVVLETQLC